MKTTYLLLHFQVISILVLIFYFHCFYSLFRKTPSILVIFVSALMANFYMANRTIKIIKKIYFGIKKNATLASKKKLIY